MKAERWQQVERLYHAALERGADGRATFLFEACAGDERLRREVESLLAYQDQAENFIESPALEVAAKRMAAERSAAVVTGQTIAHYKITSPLGAGGMGEVYLAEDTRLGRRIALKLLSAQFTGDVERVRRFEQEARAASALNHPNIVTIHEIGRSNSSHFIATEFIDGETLRRHMAGTRMRLDEVLDIATQVASALAAAHAAGIVHRDIKPENIMLRRDRIVKLLDFGLAKLASHQVAAVDMQAATNSMVKTNPGMVMGTVQYMSPEQTRALDVDARTDIWSLGVVLYEMVTGRAPFKGETPSHVVVSILESEPPLLAHYTEVPAELERIVTKALRKEREERYQVASDLALDLKSLKQELEVEARLKRFLQPDTGGRETTTKGDGWAAVETVHASAATTVDVARARPTSSAEYLVGEIKHHKRGAALAAAAVFIAIAAVAYFFYFAKSGEAIDSVAVMPFVNASADPNTEYLSEGISDSIINNLSRLPNLRVISLNSVLRYRGKQIDPQQIGRELNVRAVLMGRLVQRGDGLAVSTELVDVRDNRRLWGEQYSRKLSDILVVQDEIAREIAERLRLRLTGEEKKQLAKHYTENTEAYRLYSMGMYYARGRGKEGALKSIEYFEQAIKIDPNYALAYRGLAFAYYTLGSRGIWLSKEARQKFEWAALMAVELDDTLGDAHFALAYVKKYNWDWAGAESEHKRALELDPNSIEANVYYSAFLVDVGRLDEALVYAKRADELAPRNSTNSYLAYVYFHMRQYDKAIELHLKAKDRDPKSDRGNLPVAEAYLGKVMYEEAVAEMQKAVAFENAPERWDRHPMLAYAYAVASRRDEALKILDEQKRLAKQRYISPYNFAIIYTGLGDKDRAFEHLEKAYEEHPQTLVHLKSRPTFDSLRSDPRYPDLLQRMNLAP